MKYVIATVSQLAGQNTRALREQYGVDLATFARAMRRRGLPWSTGRVSDWEAGRVPASFETLFTVALALGDATDNSVTLPALLSGAGEVRINDRLSTRAVLLGWFAKGEAPAAGTLSATAVSPADDFLEPDERVCRRLGVTADVGARAMRKLWGRTFTAERDHRAGPDANAQRRGQISRQLQTELSNKLGK